MPRVVDHEQRRGEIILALWAVVYACGIDGVTLQRVAAEAGVSVGRIQHYFASKQDLVREGARAIVEGAEQGFVGDAATDADPLQTLRRLLAQPIPATGRFRLGSAVWYAYLAKSVSDSEIAAIVEDAVGGTIAEACRLVRAAEIGPPAGADSLATELVATANGLAQAVLVGALTPERARAILDERLDSLRRR